MNNVEHALYSKIRHFTLTADWEGLKIQHPKPFRSSSYDYKITGGDKSLKYCLRFKNLEALEILIARRRKLRRFGMDEETSEFFDLMIYLAKGEVPKIIEITNHISPATSAYYCDILLAVVASGYCDIFKSLFPPTDVTWWGDGFGWLIKEIILSGTIETYEDLDADLQTSCLNVGLLQALEHRKPHFVEYFLKRGALPDPANLIDRAGSGERSDLQKIVELNGPMSWEAFNRSLKRAIRSNRYENVEYLLKIRETLDGSMRHIIPSLNAGNDRTCFKIVQLMVNKGATLLPTKYQHLDHKYKLALKMMTRQGDTF